MAVSTQPPDNCHTIQVTNPSTTVEGLVGQGTVGVALVVGSTAFRVPAGTTRTMGIGTIQDRGAIANLIADSIGGAVTLEFSYISILGSI